MFEFWFSPFGRAARADYWYWLLIPGVLGAAFLAIVGPIAVGHTAATVILLIWLTVFFLSHIAMAIKRLHDQSLSGWYSTALILPFFLAATVIGSPEIIDLDALDRASDQVRLVLLGLFAVIFGPFAYVMGLIWFGQGKDGVNRYGRDPLYR